MGEAKRRGTYEERKRLAIERQPKKQPTTRFSTDGNQELSFAPKADEKLILVRDGA